MGYNYKPEIVQKWISVNQSNRCVLHGVTMLENLFIRGSVLKKLEEKY